MGPVDICYQPSEKLQNNATTALGERAELESLLCSPGTMSFPLPPTNKASRTSGALARTDVSYRPIVRVSTASLNDREPQRCHEICRPHLWYMVGCARSGLHQRQDVLRVQGGTLRPLPSPKSGNKNSSQSSSESQIFGSRVDCIQGGSLFLGQLCRPDCQIQLQAGLDRRMGNPVSSAPLHA